MDLLFRARYSNPENALDSTPGEYYHPQFGVGRIRGGGERGGSGLRYQPRNRLPAATIDAKLQLRKKT